MKNKLLQVSVKFGLIGSSMSILALVVLFYIGKHPLLLNPLIDARLPLYGLFVFFSLKIFRDENNGVLHFLQGLAIGFSVYLIMASLASIFIYVFASFESTHFLSSYISIAVDQITANREVLLESNIDEQTLTDALRILPNTTANNLAFDYFLKSMPIGLILTLLLSIIMRRNNN